MHRCHFILAVFLNSSPTSVLSWLCHSFTVYTHKPALLSLSPLLFIGQSRINHRIVAQRCHVIGWDDTPQRTSCCPWWYCIFFFKFDWTQCIVFLWFRPLLRISSSPDVVLYTHGWGWGQNREENLFFFSLQWERENEIEREHKSIHYCSFHPSLHVQIWPATMLIGEQEERGGAGSADQGSVAISLCVDDQEQRVGPAPPLPQTYPCVLSYHFSPDQSSRTCRQRWPPLALHCQRMMQQRHRRWPPPWTEGGGVTGAK